MEASTTSANFLARSLYGLALAAEPERMLGTGDDIFLLCADRKLVLRISEEIETEENLFFQNVVLERLASAALPFSTPKVLPSINGRLIETTVGPNPRYVRLLTYVSGIPVASISASKELLEDVGRSLAVLSQALAPISVPPPRRNLVWSIQTALELVPMTRLLSNARTRALVMAAFENFKERVVPVLGVLRHQIVHGDFNATNVLVSANGAKSVSGVIDFNDLMVGPLINDLAVAASRHSNPDDPLPGISAICAGFGSSLRLRPNEASVLFDLICLRFAMRLTVWANRAAANGKQLSPEIEGPEIKALSVLLTSEARESFRDLATT
jgi:hydroxylysine kinase